jgi:EAL domain-containing protein (putative c-di-GMP-specific phosphodiesterase class I)/GGDEF domain-containing protein
MTRVIGGAAENGKDNLRVFEDSLWLPFHARIFYELPLPGFIVDCTSKFKIVDANKAALDALDVVLSKIVSSDFLYLFRSANSDLGRDDSPLPELGSEFMGVECLLGPQFVIEISGVSQFEIDQKMFATILFFRKSLPDKVVADFHEMMFIDSVSGLSNALAAKRKLEMFDQIGPAQSRIYAVAIFSMERWQQTKMLPAEIVAKIIRKVALRIQVWESHGMFLSRHEKNGFLVVVQDNADFKKILENIFNDLSWAVVVEGHRYEFPVSAGVYVWNAWDSLAANDILHKVRDAHGQSLSIGPNRLFFYSEQQGQKGWRQADKRCIIDAFRRGDFCFHYQPLIPFDGSVVPVAAALLRWGDRDESVRAPLGFRGESKDLPVYDDITLWVLDLSLMTLERWSRADRQAKLCITISAAQLASPEFLAKMLNVMSRFSSKTFKLLSIDIFNFGKVGSCESIVSALRALGGDGLEFNIDDFTWDDASLISLDHVPVRSVKIARHCIEELEQSLSDIRSLRSLVGLGKSNGVAVYAKGVERETQYGLLKALGCNGVQGGVMSKALTEFDFLDYLDGLSDVCCETDFQVSSGFDAEFLVAARHKLSSAIAVVLDDFVEYLVPVSTLESLLAGVRNIDSDDLAAGKALDQLSVLEQNVSYILSFKPELPKRKLDYSWADKDGRRATLILDTVIALSELIVRSDNKTLRVS